MRFYAPLAGRAREIENKDSLPPLHEPFRAGSMSSNANANNNWIKGGVGWRAPPSKSSDKNAAPANTKVPTQTQVEVAKRLTQGMSSTPLSYAKPKTSQNTSTTSAANYAALQLDRDNYSIASEQAMYDA